MLADGVLLSSGNLNQLDLAPGASATVEVPYGTIEPVPGTDTRWLTITAGDGRGIRVEGDPLFSFAAMNFLHDDFESPGSLAGYRPDARLVNTHIDDVRPRDLVRVNIDYSQMGVGGDDSWGARTHLQYCLRDDSYLYSFRIVPLWRQHGGRCRHRYQSADGLIATFKTVFVPVMMLLTS